MDRIHELPMRHKADGWVLAVWAIVVNSSTGGTPSGQDPAAFSATLAPATTAAHECHQTSTAKPITMPADRAMSSMPIQIYAI